MTADSALRSNERSILTLLVQGKSDEAIAQELSLQREDVTAYVAGLVAGVQRT